MNANGHFQIPVNSSQRKSNAIVLTVYRTQELNRSTQPAPEASVEPAHIPLVPFAAHNAISIDWCRYCKRELSLNIEGVRVVSVEPDHTEMYLVP
jgi:hypothetical protein